MGSQKIRKEKPFLPRIERCITALIKSNVQLKETGAPPMEVGRMAVNKHR